MRGRMGSSIGTEVTQEQVRAGTQLDLLHILDHFSTTSSCVCVCVCVAGQNGECIKGEGGAAAGLAAKETAA